MENKTYSIGSVTFNHGAQVVIEPHANSVGTVVKYRGCVGTVCGTGYRTSKYDSSYLLVDLGGITIQCDPSEVTAIGMRRVVQEKRTIQADGKR